MTFKKNRFYLFSRRQPDDAKRLVNTLGWVGVRGKVRWVVVGLRE